MEETKICTKCGRELPLSEFALDKTHKDGRRGSCKECNRKKIEITLLENEEWRDVKGYEGLYQVSDKGRIKSFGRTKTVKSRWGTYAPTKFPERIMALSKDRDGYRLVTLTGTDKKQKQHRVHIIVAEAFVPNPNNCEIVHHKNRNKEDNNPSNLEWMTKEEHYNEHASEIAEALEKIETLKGDKHPFYGKKRPEHAKKLSIPIVEIEKDGTVVEWDSAKICAEKCGHGYIRLIRAINGKNRKKGHYYKTSQFYKKEDYKKLLEDLASQQLN
mgnify:CR=1 FL=1